MIPKSVSVIVHCSHGQTLIYGKVHKRMHKTCHHTTGLTYGKDGFQVFLLCSLVDNFFTIIVKYNVPYVSKILPLNPQCRQSIYHLSDEKNPPHLPPTLIENT